MEIAFATLNVVIKLKAYYTCVREMEHFLQLKTFLSHLQVPVLSSVSSLDLLTWAFFQITNLQT